MKGRHIMKKNNIEKKNAADIIAAKFIEKLENNIVPWVKPWEHWTSWSRSTGNDYRGINTLLLSGGEFATFKQIKEDGGKVNKGAKAEQIVNYTEYSRKVSDIDSLTPAELARVYVDENGETRMKCKSVRYYNVFRLDNTDLKQKHDKTAGKVHEWDALEQAEKIIKAYTEAAGIDITHGSNQAFATGGFAVTLPMREQFASAAEYYSTMFHELTHTTAPVQGRDLSGYHKSRKERAREELVAEIGAAYIMSYLGIETEFTEANSAAYMKSWAANLKDDSSAILYAAPKAIDAAEQIINSLEQAGDKTPTDPEETEREALEKKFRDELTAQGLPESLINAAMEKFKTAEIVETSEGTAEETEAAEQSEAETPDFENVDFKKGEYYIRTREGAKAITGYIFDIAGVKFGVAKSGKLWNITHIGTGLLAQKYPGNTRKEAVKNLEEIYSQILTLLKQGNIKEKTEEFEELKRAAA